MAIINQAELIQVQKVKGYTAQARFYHQHMDQDAAGEWTQAGYVKLAHADARFTPSVKPVWKLKDGRKVIILDGANHLTIQVYQVPDAGVVVSEELAWKA